MAKNNQEHKTSQAQRQAQAKVQAAQTLVQMQARVNNAKAHAQGKQEHKVMQWRYTKTSLEQQ